MARFPLPHPHVASSSLSTSSRANPSRWRGTPPHHRFRPPPTNLTPPLAPPRVPLLPPRAHHAETPWSRRMGSSSPSPTERRRGRFAAFRPPQPSRFVALCSWPSPAAAFLHHRPCAAEHPPDHISLCYPPHRHRYHH